jgi:hypothetical protein
LISSPCSILLAVTCEEKFKNAEKFSFDETSLNTDIRRLMESYHNWGELLAPAPVAISTLGQLIIMSTQRLDFPIDTNVPTGGFKHIKYPKSFRTTLLQISHDGYLAFRKAHVNMERISMYSSNTPTHIKDATRYLMTRNEIYIVNLLPLSLRRIRETADQSKQLSLEVANEFGRVIELIRETVDAISETRNYKTDELQQVQDETNLSQFSRNILQSETKMLDDKDKMLSNMLNSFGARQKNIFIRTIYGSENFVVNLNKDRLTQTEGRHQLQKNVFYGKNNWHYTFYDRQVKSDRCADQNTQHLSDVLVTVGQYRLKYELWQNSRANRPFNGRDDVSKLQQIFTTMVRCDSVVELMAKGGKLVNMLQSAKFELLQKNSTRPGAEEMDDLIRLIHHVRVSAKVQEKSVVNSKNFRGESLVHMWEFSFKHQFQMLQSMINTTTQILNVNNKQMELQRKKNEEIIGRIKQLDLAKISHKEAIEALNDGLEVLGLLQRDWLKLIEFYEKMSRFISKATEDIVALVEVVRVVSKDVSNLDDDKMFGNLLEAIEKSNQATFLMHGVSEMYVNVSQKFIMDRVANLDSMMSINDNNAGLSKVLEEQRLLKESAQTAYDGIIQYIKDGEKIVKNKLLERRNQIMDEYQWMVDCAASVDREFSITSRGDPVSQ